ncbi:hypothetical protein ACFVXE_31250 [Streptomyces sp. NPDC058231]|uniref:hypothetical protein n=1 Tax=Streptomyces sp. NPDC058231 TaxID=3346392 RepID=UPI0036EF62EE
MSGDNATGEAAERPRADCTVDGENRLVVRLALPAAYRPQLLLRLRPPKGEPERITRVVDLEPAGQDHWHAVLDPEPAFAEGRWDLYVLRAPGEPRSRLLPGARDLRALMADSAPDRTPLPLAVRIPYTTLDGYLAVRAWLRTAHAEAGRIGVGGRAMTVRARLFGAEAGHGAAAVLRRRGRNSTEREVALTADGRHDISFTADYRELLTAPGSGPAVWDVFVRPASDTPRIRVARLLDDVADRKEVFVYRATELDGMTVRPYYTVDNELSVEVAAG